MSEVKTADDQNRKPYILNIEPDDFNQIYDGKILTSIEFCKLTNEIFNAAFCNFYGSKFEVMGGRPVINLFFSHMDQAPDSVTDQDGNVGVAHIATERFNGNKVGSTVIDKTRGRDNRMTNGDKFYLTQDGQDIIKTLLFGNLYNNGKPNWNQIVTETAENNCSSIYGTMNQLQLTKVTGINPERVAALIWGKKDEDGDIEYGVSVLRDLSFGGFNGIPNVQQAGKNYALNITRAHNNAIAKTCENLGIGLIGSNIIR